LVRSVLVVPFWLVAPIWRVALKVVVEVLAA
jgi:hypothetical protein